jgi:serine protease Do
MRLGLMHNRFLPATLFFACVCLTAPRSGALPPAANTLHTAVDRALPCVVKIYGGTIGRTRGFGTGVLTSPDGEIVTVDSILLDARNLRVFLSDGRLFRAEVVRRDPIRRLALLRIQGRDLPYLSPESSLSLQIGDGVLAAGNSFKVAEGEEQVSVLFGVLTARTQIPLRSRAQPLEYGGELLIVDAITSNPGMSGGPLLDVNGQWVGLIGPIADSTTTNTRINYAIPVEEVAAFISAQPLVGDTEDGTPRSVASTARPYLGIRLFRVGYRQTAAYVDSVLPDSPAAAAGVRSDDLIIAIDGRRIGSSRDYEQVTANLRPGQTVNLTLKRGDSVIQAQLVVGEAP